MFGEFLIVNSLFIETDMLKKVALLEIANGGCLEVVRHL
jgi:hypothetical protein